jgi:hypothetical protein
VSDSKKSIQGGNTVNALKRYELIRPILKGEKTAKQVHQETEVPLGTIYRHLKRLRESDGQVESLADKSSTPLSNPKWLTEEEKDLVVAHKLSHPHQSTRQIAAELRAAGILQIHDRTVANILKERRLPPPFYPINRPN